jgi:hypothetical protein
VPAFGHSAHAAVQPKAVLGECSSSLADITWRPTANPSYCSGTQNPQLVAEFNIYTAFGSGLIPPAGTTPQLTNTAVTITLNDGRTVTVDPTLEIASGGLEAVVTQRSQVVGECNGFTWRRSTCCQQRQDSGQGQLCCNAGRMPCSELLRDRQMHTTYAGLLTSAEVCASMGQTPEEYVQELHNCCANLMPLAIMSCLCC